MISVGLKATINVPRAQPIGPIFTGPAYAAQNPRTAKISYRQLYIHVYNLMKRDAVYMI